MLDVQSLDFSAVATTASIQPKPESIRLRLISYAMKMISECCFSSFQGFPAAITLTVLEINRENMPDGIVKLAKPWDAVIAKQGGYI